MPKGLRELNIEVTRLIMYVERLEDQNSAEAVASYAELSLVEEAIADLTPESEAGGQIARRGAVRAAVNSGDLDRAIMLVASFIAAGSDGVLAAQLIDLLPPR